MAIEITGYRDKDGERFINPLQTKTSNEALDFFVDELKFGALVINIEDIGANAVRITTRVSFWGCVDHTFFTGTRDEMRFLTTLAGYYSMTTSKSAAAKMAADLLNKRLPPSKQGNPLLLSFFANQAIGEILLRLSAMLAAGITDDADLDLAAKANFKDTIAAAQLAHEGTCSFREAISIAQ